MEEITPSTTLPTEEGFYIFMGGSRFHHQLRPEILWVRANGDGDLWYIGNQVYNPKTLTGAWIPLDSTQVESMRAAHDKVWAESLFPQAYEKFLKCFWYKKFEDWLRSNNPPLAIKDLIKKPENLAYILSLAEDKA